MPRQEDREKAIASIQDLLPNEQILNFYTGLPVLPGWLKHPFNLVLGSGDLLTGKITNIEYHSAYNIFACLPWSSDDSLRQNVEYLLSNQKEKKILCFLDMNNQEHVERFVQVFQESIDYIGYDIIPSGLPRFPYRVIGELLSDKGVATFVYPPSSSVIPLREFERVLGQSKDDLSFYNENIAYSLAVKVVNRDGPLKDESLKNILPIYRNSFENAKKSIVQSLQKNYGLLFDETEFESILESKPIQEKVTMFRNFFADIRNLYSENPYYMKTKTDGENYKISWLRPSFEIYSNLTKGTTEYGLVYRKTIFSFNLPSILQKADKKIEKGMDETDMKKIKLFVSKRIIPDFTNGKVFTSFSFQYSNNPVFLSLIEKLQSEPNQSGGKRKKTRRKTQLRKQSRRYRK